MAETTAGSERFSALPDDQTLAATVVALEEHGFSDGTLVIASASGSQLQELPGRIHIVLLRQSIGF